MSQKFHHKDSNTDYVFATNWLCPVIFTTTLLTKKLIQYLDPFIETKGMGIEATGGDYVFFSKRSGSYHHVWTKLQAPH